MLMPVAIAGALTLPATSVQVPLADWPAPSVVNVIGAVQLAMPDKASAPLKVTVTLVLFQPAAFGAGDAAAAAVGAVRSILTVTEAVRTNPAPFVAVQETTVPAVSVVKLVGSQLVNSVLIPEIGSLTFQLTVVADLSQPAALGVGATVGVTSGGVVSIRTTVETVVVKPAPSVARHVNVEPAVSAVNVTVPQPLLDVIPDSGSETLQLKVTGVVVFHPEAFGDGLIVGVTTGGVVSPVAFTTLSCVGNPRATRSAVARDVVFPAASETKTASNVQMAFSLPWGKVSVTLLETEVLGVGLAEAVCVDPPEALTNEPSK
jgi:hypothetical protein